MPITSVRVVQIWLLIEIRCTVSPDGLTAKQHGWILYTMWFWERSFCGVRTLRYLLAHAVWAVYFRAHGPQHSCIWRYGMSCSTGMPYNSVGSTKILGSLSFQTERNKNQDSYLVIEWHVTVTSTKSRSFTSLLQRHCFWLPQEWTKPSADVRKIQKSFSDWKRRK